MRKLTLSLFLIFSVIQACKTITKSESVLPGPENMQVEQFTVQVNSDTTLITKNGALLGIDSGSFEGVRGNSITLEIKEAYSIQQMVRAGLVTVSGNGPLSSGGMIYINAVGGQKVTIKKPIKVAIPTDYIEKGMQVYKGNKTKEGTIEWTDPAPLPANSQLSSINDGEVLFQNRCASCHTLTTPKTGPPLAHILKRFNDYGEEGGSYLEHAIPREYSHSKYEVYKCNLINQYNHADFNIFSPQTDSSIITDRDVFLNVEKIYQYIQNESDKRNLTLPPQADLLDCVDSCMTFIDKVQLLQQIEDSLKERKADLSNQKVSMVIQNNQVNGAATTTVNNSRPQNFEEIVQPSNYESVFYQFSIETFGWYNIDILMKGMNGVEDSQLFARIVGSYREKVQVYLIIPSVKLYLPGGLTGRHPDEYAFYKKDGSIPLPQGAKAYILAVTETDDSIAFALNQFIASTQQEIMISLNKSSKEIFHKAIESIDGKDLKIKAMETKNAAEVRRTDTLIGTVAEEKAKANLLRPVNCDCDCRVKDHLSREMPGRTNPAGRNK